MRVHGGMQAVAAAQPPVCPPWRGIGASGQPDSLLNPDGSLSAYGQQVAGYIAQSGASGCPLAAIAPADIIAAAQSRSRPVAALPIATRRPGYG